MDKIDFFSWKLERVTLKNPKLYVGCGGENWKKKLIINIDNLFHKKINSQQELLDRF
jgi:hypothetical protein